MGIQGGRRGCGVEKEGFKMKKGDFGVKKEFWVGEGGFRVGRRKGGLG